MNANGYQNAALATAIFLDSIAKLKREELETSLKLAYCGLGLAGEAGEVADKIKKAIRDKGGVESLKGDESLMKELGDVTWYLAVISNLVGFGFSDVMKTNLDKLASRHERGTVKGEGDDR